MTPLVTAALTLATQAHKGQFRKDGITPYIEHPKAVAEIAARLYDEACEGAFSDPRTRDLIQVVALGYDIEEDVKGWTARLYIARLDALVKMEPREMDEAIRALDLLNKHLSKDYLDFTLRADGDFIARLVKRGDLTHNLLTLDEGSLKEKYRLALYILEH